MSDTPTTRLFAISMSAWHLVDDRPETVMQSGIGLLLGDADTEQSALQHAHDIFPDVNGWQGHMVAVTEIPQDMIVGPFRLTWGTELLYQSEGVES